MFKDLLVATTREGDDAAAIANACALALSCDAHVTVLVQAHVAVPPADAAMGAFAAEAFVAAYELGERIAEEDCRRWREALRVAGVMGEVRRVDDVLAKPARIAALQARCADVSFVGLGDYGALPAGVHDEVSNLLAGSGRPVIVVPKAYEPAPFARIAIAWRPGTHAARAVHDAMPLLARAENIDVICVGPGGQGQGVDNPGADLARHLARHDLQVAVHLEEGVGEETGAVLLRRARALGCDLLVMGGYGHSRLREWAFGGTTRHVLAHALLPVLLSH